MRHRAAWLVLCLLLLAPLAAAEPDDDAGVKAMKAGLAKLYDLGAVQPKRPWTWIGILNGDSDLERSMIRALIEREELFCDDDLRQRTMYGVILLDRAKGYSEKFGDWTSTRVYRLSCGDGSKIRSPLLADCGELDMSHPETLRRFISAAMRTFPAERYLLSVGTHGAGWATFLGDHDAPGSTKGKSRGDIFVLHDALQAALQDVGRERIDVISIDSCIMGQLDMAVALKDFADYLITSEAVSRGGLVTDRFVSRGISASPGDLRRALKLGLQAVRDEIRLEGKALEQCMITKSVLDLRRMDDLVAALNALLRKLLLTAQRDWATYVRAILSAEAYVPPDDLTRGRQARASFDLVDIIQRIRVNVPDFAAEAEYQRFMAAVKACIIANLAGTQRPRSHGLAIYAPVRPGLLNPNYGETPLAKASVWPHFLATIHALQLRRLNKPRIDGVRLQDAQGRPTDKLRALSGCRAAFTLTGTDFLGLDFGIAVPKEKADVVLFKTAFRQGLTDAQRRGRSPQERELLLPRLPDGSTRLSQELGGVLFKLVGSGLSKEPVYVTVETMGSEQETITTKGVMRPVKGEDMQVVLHFDRQSWRCVDVVWHRTDKDGNVEGSSHVAPLWTTSFHPKLEALTADRKRHEVEHGEICWDEDTHLILDLIPPGKQALYLQAHTVVGLDAVERVPFTMEAPPLIRRYVDSDKRYHAWMLNRTWRLEEASAERKAPGAAVEPQIRWVFSQPRDGWPNLTCTQHVGGRTTICDAHYESEGLSTLSLYRRDAGGQRRRTHLFAVIPESEPPRGTPPTFRLYDLGAHGVLRLIPVSRKQPLWQRLLGTWVSADGLSAHIEQTKYRLIQDGKQIDAGTFTLKGSRMVTTNQSGDIEILQVSVDGNTLRIVDEDGATFVLERKT